MAIALIELWRLRWNFIVLVVFNFIEGIGETSTLSSFHQFITNPREPLNNTQSVSVHATVRLWGSCIATYLRYMRINNHIIGVISIVVYIVQQLQAQHYLHGFILVESSMLPKYGSL